MDQWIDFARGPLFRIAFAIMILGLTYRVATTIAHIISAWWRAGDRRLPTRDIAVATLSWIVPVRLIKVRPITSISSFLLHLGLVIVPLFFLGHVALLKGVLPAAWPVLPPAIADGLTVVALVALLVLIFGRIVVPASRRLSRVQDHLILLTLFAMLLFGFLASHASLSPFPARAMLLTHLLLGNLVLILMPITKIAHCALYPFTQLVFQLGWHFPANSGRHVATALGKEGEPV